MKVIKFTCILELYNQLQNLSALFDRFVSISRNYRSVIRACMEELQRVAGSFFYLFIF